MTNYIQVYQVVWIMQIFDGFHVIVFQYTNFHDPTLNCYSVTLITEVHLVTTFIVLIGN
jgi:hypothetical protein